jgi:hypothetical protein
VPHDWSLLHYHAHSAKHDRVPLSQSRDHGYELLTSLAVSDCDGAPLAPVCQQLRAADGVYSTRVDRRLADRSQLDMLDPVLAHIETLHLGKPVVHLIDAEADSVAHYRRWARRGHRFLIRADAGRRVRWEGRECLLGDVVTTLRQRDVFRPSRSVAYRGQQARQWVAQVEVTLHRPAKPHRRGQPRRTVPGVALTLRLVVGQLRGDAGEVLENWLLWTNVPAEVPAERLLLWYYWRWQIETYFKLLKSAGQAVEAWQQETAAAIAKRLLVAGMACVVVWELDRAAGAEAATLRALLVRLSGRQMRRGRAHTQPALLAGLWVLLAWLDVVEHTDLDEIRRLAEWARPRHAPADSG